MTVELPPPEVRRAIRRRAGLRLQDVGALLGVTMMSVSRWERTMTPGDRHREAYAAVLRRLVEETRQ